MKIKSMLAASFSFTQNSTLISMLPSCAQFVYIFEEVFLNPVIYNLNNSVGYTYLGALEQKQMT